MTSAMRARVTRDRRVGWMTAICVALVALGSTAALLTKGPGEDPQPTQPLAFEDLDAGELGIRTSEATFDGSVVEIRMEFVNESAIEVRFDPAWLTAVDADEVEAAMQTPVNTPALEEAVIAPGSSYVGYVAFATTTAPGDLTLTFASPQLAAPMTPIPVQPG